MPWALKRMLETELTSILPPNRSRLQRLCWLLSLQSLHLDWHEQANKEKSHQDCNRSRREGLQVAVGVG